MSLKHRLVLNTFWSVSGLIGNSLIQLVANIVFARFLTPTEFGQIGIAMFFVLFSNVLVEGGMGGALVRKIDSTRKDFSTVFVFNFFVSLFLYSLILLNAGKIASFYQDPELKKILIVTGSILVINSFYFVQNNKLVKKLQFKKIAKYRLISVFSANCIGITLAIFSFGIWAIITTLILTPLFQSILLWYKEGPIGKIIFCKKSFKSLYSFGVNTSIATIIDTTFNNIYQLVLGRYFSIMEVGYYYQAKKLQDVPNNIVFGTTNSVIFSGLAKLQNEPRKFTDAYNKIISYFSILIGLITLMIMTFSKEIIILLYGQKWESSGFFLFILSLVSFFYVHEMFNRVIFKTFDKTRIILQLELIKKAIVTISIVIGVVLLNMKILLYGFLLVSIISYLINYFVSKKITETNTWSELQSLLRVVFSLIISYLVILTIKNFFEIHSYYTIVLIPLILFIYFSLLRIQGIKINIKEFNQIIKTAKKLN